MPTPPCPVTNCQLLIRWYDLSGWFKDNNSGTNQKDVCNFLLANNSNVGRMLRHVWRNYIVMSKNCDFGTNQKDVCNFLLANNSNVGRMLRHVWHNYIVMSKNCVVFTHLTVI